jgi:hypothetical protein
VEPARALVRDYVPPRTTQEVAAQFEDLPWRQGRSGLDARTIGGVPRLSELCMSGTRKLAAIGRLGDADCIPDDLLKLATGIPEESLALIEDQNPSRIVALDAAWATLVGGDVLPDEQPRWRTYYEQKRARHALELEAASARMRARYSAEHEGVAQRTIAAMRHVPGVTAPIRRRRVNASTGGPPMSELDRLRTKVNKERKISKSQRLNPALVRR